jgi:hypothetical protein
MKAREFQMADRRGPQDARRFWLTPPGLMDALEAEFSFTFDACPHPRPAGFDGLMVPWGTSTWVNPPYTGISWTKWARKAIAEASQEKTVVIAIPTFAARGITILCIGGGAVNVEWRMLGLVRWIAIEDGAVSDMRNPSPVLLAIVRPKVVG